MPLPNQIPAAPVDMLMPLTANAVYGWITYGLLAVVSVLMVRQALRSGSALPICALIGGALSVLLEPLFDAVLCLWYAQIGDYQPLFRAFNVSIPLWILPSYALYMGAQGYWMSLQFGKGLSAARLWKTLAVFFCADVMLEMPGINLGIYAYYGDQPFKLFGFPLWMGVTNALVPVLVGAAFHGLRSVLVGPRVLLAIPAVPMVVVAAEAATGWPVWLALNADVGLVGTHAAALITIALTVSAAWLVGLLAPKAAVQTVGGSVAAKKSRAAGVGARSLS